MIGEYDLIYDYVVSILGEYVPIITEDGVVCLNWGYLFAGGCLLIACWFCFRGFLMLLKGVLGSYV